MELAHHKTFRLLRRHVPSSVRNSNTTMQDRTNRFTPVSLLQNKMHLQSTCYTSILLQISYFVMSYILYTPWMLCTYSIYSG